MEFHISLCVFVKACLLARVTMGDWYHHCFPRFLHIPLSLLLPPLPPTLVLISASPYTPITRFFYFLLHLKKNLRSPRLTVIMLDLPRAEISTEVCTENSRCTVLWMFQHPMMIGPCFNFPRHVVCG